MKSEWISVTDKLPKKGESVLTYYYDEHAERGLFGIHEYHKKGDTLLFEALEREIPFLQSLFNNIGIKAQEDGFYILDTDEYGYLIQRKHKDIITHWKYLTSPDGVTYKDGLMFEEEEE